MKKGVKNPAQGKSISDIEKEISDLRKELAKLHLEHQVSMPKDTNIVVKKRKQLAVLAAIINSQKDKKNTH